MATLQRLNSEIAVLSSCFNNLDSGWYGIVAQVGGNNPETLFSDPKHQKIFAVIGDIYNKDQVPSISGIVDRLENSNPELFNNNVAGYVNTIRLSAPLATIHQLKSVSDDLEKFRTLRNQVNKVEQILDDIKNPEVEAEPGDVASLLQEVVDNTSVKTDAQTFAEITQEILDSPRAMWTQTTGIPSLDQVLGGSGLESGCLTIVAARPKVGKTILMNTLVHNTVERGAIPIVLNYETKRVEFVAKMIARYIADPHLNWGLVKRYLSNDENAILNATQREQVQRGIEWSLKQEWNAFFDKTMSMQDIHAHVLNTKAKAPAGSKIVIFVDYIQLQVMNARYEREELTQLTRFYKRLAGEFDVSVLCLSQLNREEKSGGPSPTNLRGSGSLEQDADAIILLDRPSRLDENAPKHILEVYAGTTRLSSGDTFELFIDGGTNIVSEMPEELIDDSDDFLEDEI